VISERVRVRDALRGLDLEVPESQGNFVWVAAGERAVPIGEACEARGVVLRPFAGFGVRITIGTPDENDVMLRVMGEALAEIDG
jgi:histidinol-phosphate aminotransferase